MRTAETFSADTWRRVGHGVLSAPVGLAAVLLVLFGRHRRAAALQRQTVRRLLDAPSTPDAPDRPLATLTYAILSVPFGLVGLWLALMIGPNTVRNLLYGFFVDGSYATSWGGPTLAGAWTVHAALALLLVPVGLWLVRGLTALQRRLADALLGGRRLPVAAAAGSVAVLLGAGLFLTAWLHQV